MSPIALRPNSVPAPLLEKNRSRLPRRHDLRAGDGRLSARRFGYRTPFLLAAGLQVLTLLLTWFLLPESIAKKGERGACVVCRHRQVARNPNHAFEIQKLAYSLGFYPWFAAFAFVLQANLAANKLFLRRFRGGEHSRAAVHRGTADQSIRQSAEHGSTVPCISSPCVTTVRPSQRPMVLFSAGFQIHERDPGRAAQRRSARAIARHPGGRLIAGKHRRSSMNLDRRACLYGVGPTAARSARSSSSSRWRLGLAATRRRVRTSPRPLPRLPGGLERPGAASR